MSDYAALIRPTALRRWGCRALGAICAPACTQAYLPRWHCQWGSLKGGGVWCAAAPGTTIRTTRGRRTVTTTTRTTGTTTSVFGYVVSPTSVFSFFGCGGSCSRGESRRWLQWRWLPEMPADHGLQAEAKGGSMAQVSPVRTAGRGYAGRRRAYSEAGAPPGQSIAPRRPFYSCIAWA